MTSREIHARYRDPLDLLWLATARALGVRVVRSAEVFASWDGAGTLTLGSAETLDADDCLAQLVLHEICHALVEGPEAFHRVDWGLCNTDDRDLVREHACIRLQTALADRHGLRALLAVTTDFRAYGDALPPDPLCGDDETADPAVAIARAAWPRATTGPWAEVIERALWITAAIAALVRPLADEDDLWNR